MISLLIGFSIGAGVPTLLLQRWLAHKRRARIVKAVVGRGLALLKDNVGTPKDIHRSYDPVDIAREFREKVLHGTRFQ